MGLYNQMKKHLIKDETEHILNDIEIPLAYVLSSMEKEGFKVDLDGLNEYSSYLSELERKHKTRIFELAGEEFNVNSPKQLGEILFGKLGLPHGKKTKSGYSTSAEILEDLADEYEIVSEVLEYRHVAKLNSTYCQGLTKVADENGIIHSTFNQTVAVTGRLSSTEPNLQNIPIRTDLGKALRKYFITKSNDYVLIDADYSQIELKVLAHMSRDANMIYAFNSGADIHTATASLVFGVEPNMVTAELRKRAKAVNFGIVYGIGDFSLSKDLGISKKEAKAYIDSYFATYPDVHAFIRRLINDAREYGYAKTMLGRIRYIPELSAKNKMVQAFGERAAMNSPIQGTAADIIKLAMINVDKALKAAKIDARLILQVHDELIIEAHKDCAEIALNILKQEMEGAFKLSVPLTADIAVGTNWLEAK
jgi:DNA polymerase-1